MNRQHFHTEINIGNVKIDGTIVYHEDVEREGRITTVELVIDNILLHKIGRRKVDFGAACSLRDANFARLVDESYKILQENS